VGAKPKLKKPERQSLKNKTVRGSWLSFNIKGGGTDPGTPKCKKTNNKKNPSLVATSEEHCTTTMTSRDPVKSNTQPYNN